MCYFPLTDFEQSNIVKASNKYSKEITNEQPITRRRIFTASPDYWR